MVRCHNRCGSPGEFFYGLIVMAINDRPTPWILRKFGCREAVCFNGSNHGLLYFRTSSLILEILFIWYPPVINTISLSEFIPAANGSFIPDSGIIVKRLCIIF